ncbi:porin [Oxalobacteraceae bacterium OM1]|nr:porin [Oxalobacteraceae bacterium OM1]
MKKSLLALAVFGAFAGAASAQTNVTIYGVIDAGITRETGAPAGDVWKLATGVQSGNRIGFKGSEDLGAGLKANFTLENGFDADTGALRQGGRLFGRQAWVGLSGNFGAVNFGRQYNPLFVALDSIDPFGTGLAGHIDTIFNPSNVRTDNAITYSAPGNLGGFTFSGMYALGEQPGDNKRGRTYGLSVGYANGPINVVLAYDNNNAIATPTTTNAIKLTMLGGTYDFGVAKLHAAYETEKSDAGADFRDWMIGASAPLGAGNVIATYARKNDRAAAGNAGSKLYALGYTYNLSKRTNFYTAYGHVNNDAAGTAFVGDASSGGIPATAGGPNTSGFNIGIRHKF